MKYRLILSLSPAVLVLCVHVQGQATMYACDLLRDCRSCMVNGTNCVFAAGECLRECRDDGASCYSVRSHPELDMEGICELYDADNAKCTSQTSCPSCVATVKSDLGPCKWYPPAFYNGGGCFGGGTGPFGSGEMTCSGDAGDAPTTDPPAPSMAPVETTVAPTTLAPAPTTLAPAPTTLAPAPTDPPATAPPSTISGTASPNTTAPPLEAACQAAASNCESCLDATCAWLPNVEECVPDCSTLADGDCYLAAAESPVTGQICLLAATVAADRELCFAQETCKTCLETSVSDGSACQWYKDMDTELSWCEINGCNMDGICGESTCDVVVSEGNATASNTTTTTTPADDGPCYDFQDCTSCLSSTEGCAWSANACLPSCSMIADAPCVDAQSRLNTSVPEICESTSPGEEDDILCGRKNYCFTCTSTMKADGVTNCAWYNDNAGKEWCGTGGCDVNGICGETDENICLFPTDPPFTSDPAEDLTSAPAATSAVTQHFSGIGSVVAAVALVLGCMDVV